MSKNKIIPLIIYPENNGYVNSLTPTINGTGEPASEISVLLNDLKFNTRVDELGAWSVLINNQLVDGQNYSLMVKQTNKENIISDTFVIFNVNINGLQQHSINSPANNSFINTSTPTISGNGKPGAIIEMSVNSEAYITNVDANGFWSIKIDKPFLDGLVTANIIQKDKGNISPALILNLTIDTQAPQAPKIVSPSEMGYINNPNPTIIGQAESNATVNVVVDDKTYSTKADDSGKWNIEVSEQLLDDVHILSAKQQDLAGNISPEAVSLFNVDTIAPQAPIINSPVNGNFVKSASPRLTGLGEAGNRVELKYNAKLYSTIVNQDGEWALDITEILPNGTHTFNVYQVDKSSNYSPSTILMIIIETIAPLAPAIIYPLDEEYVNTRSFVTKGTGKPDAKIEVKLAGKSYYTSVLANGSWSVQIDDILADNQAYSILASQTDLAGNVSPTVRVKFKVDTKSPPAPNVLYPINNSIINVVSPTISGKSNINATINAQINNINYSTNADNLGNWSIPINQRLSDGTNEIKLLQIDKGNSSEEITVSFTIDTSIPIAPSIISPRLNEIIKENKIIINGSGEFGATIDLKLDDKCYSTTVGNDGFWNITFDFIDIGIHTVVVHQIDVAGNSSPNNIINFIVDVPLNNYTPNNKPAIGTVTYNSDFPNWTTMTIATLTTDKPVKINNTIGKVFTKIITENGVHTFNFQDLEGVSGFVDAGVTWIDNTPPAIFIEYNGNYFSADKTIKYNTSQSGLKSALLNGVCFESGKVVSCEGYYTVQITDNAGNVSQKNFVIDKSTPNIIGVENNGIYNGEIYICFNDNMSGIKFATLDDKPFASGSIVNEKGNHLLKVSDFGDNIIEYNFVIN